MHAELESLLNLQEKDKVVMEIEGGMRDLEPELQSLDDELAAAENALEAAQQRAEEADRRRAELEAKIESYRVMQERRRQRLEWVRGAKEASTLMAELDLARTVLAKEEAEWVRSADRVEEARGTVTEHDTLLTTLRETQAPQREEIAAKLADLDERLQVARGAREEAAKRVPRPVYQRYNRILQGRAPLALYAVQSGACGHCFTAVPLHRLQKLRNGEPCEACEACGVLLYDPEQ